MKKMKNKEKFVLSTKLLVDPTGKKMGKTEGNMVNLDDSPNDMFGKIMSFPDELILVGFELLTDLSQEKIELLKTDLGGNLNPRDAKADLAFEVVKQLHTEQAATDARDNFDKTFRDKQMPEDIREVKPSLRKMQLVGALVEFGLAESKSQAQRLIEQGGVKIDGVVAEDAFTEIEFSKPVIIQVGKLNFVRVLPND
jgi:tyrosyl-tRNA synthetase